MQVILLERVGKLGHMGDVVSVREGYARNFLLPQGKALRATEANIKGFEARKAGLAQQNEDSRKTAEAVAETLDGKTFVIIRSASDAGALYGSVSPRDAVDAANEAGYALERRMIVLAAPIKELGVHDVRVHLHPEVDVTIRLNVARSPEEAELQASGRTIQDAQAEADAEAEFEIAGLFDDLGAAGRDEDGEPVSRDREF
ncbi:50S ribosomal protein L9 [Paracoccus sp. S-4012]|uniref:50S ribosomal protein L9 n=1 Tax=Paracoccus sp. S-4012 TaxID=2665648 RepID=UPI0012AF1A90|nr:50S ribosomal protein L9 [Paracoccus sp. S-4012]MRX49085.1 50S ribosomal protein L9 [Paracoccus sp. S-4012]